MTRVLNHGRFIPSFFAAVLVGSFCLDAHGAIPKKQKSNGPRVVESVAGQYLVRLSDARSLYSMKALERQLGAEIVDRVRDDVVLVQRPIAETKTSAMKTLRSLSYVRAVEPNFIYRANRAPDDTNYKELWGLRNTGALDSKMQKGLPRIDISAEDAWEITTGSKAVVVAVIDTGIDFSIPDLKDNAWTNSAEANGAPGVDDDGNGYVDDIHGYDFAHDDGDPIDDHSHGSHCAGTIGGRGNDGAGVVGVNWNVTLMAVKFLDENGSGNLANAVKAVDYARKMGAKIMSNSWGGGGKSAILEQAIEDAKAADVLFVAAAGNDGSDNDEFPTFPANYAVDNVLAVAAVDNRGELAAFSNFGVTTVHVAAPGVNVLSTTPNGLKFYSGTSMATPHVAGIAALVASVEPMLTYSELKAKVTSTARKTKALEGKVASGGLANAYSALTGTVLTDEYDASAWADQRMYSAELPNPYPSKHDQSFTISVAGANHVAARFSRFKTEAHFDKVTFWNAAGEKLGEWSGERAAGTYSPIADGDTLVLRFTSDENVSFEGFAIDGVAVD
ncbi:MAG: S8 family serine peptidase [Bdellovibrionota bacterium]